MLLGKALGVVVGLVAAAGSRVVGACIVLASVAVCRRLGSDPIRQVPLLPAYACGRALLYALP
jgi:hypothetical protein